MKVLKNLDDPSSSIEDIFVDEVDLDNYPNYVPDPDEPHLLHPGQKAQFCSRLVCFNQPLTS